MPRWVLPLLAALLGVAGGIVYGWVINPVKFVDTTPASLRADYRTDYVLMVAESYHANQDEALARQRLAILGTDSAASISEAAVKYAEQSSHPQQDIALLQELTRALQASAPLAPTVEGTP